MFPPDVTNAGEIMATYCGEHRLVRQVRQTLYQRVSIRAGEQRAVFYTRYTHWRAVFYTRYMHWRAVFYTRWRAPPRAAGAHAGVSCADTRYTHASCSCIMLVYHARASCSCIMLVHHARASCSCVMRSCPLSRPTAASIASCGRQPRPQRRILRRGHTQTHAVQHRLQRCVPRAAVALLFTSLSSASLLFSSLSSASLSSASLSSASLSSASLSSTSLLSSVSSTVLVHHPAFCHVMTLHSVISSHSLSL
jgi:hypothetical protein